MGLSTTVTAARRRAPVQERSQETVGRIHTAAAGLLGRGVAAHALTTAQIATEAGLSVGALYRFFPDKQAIIDAIAIGHLEAFQDELAGRLLADLPETPAAFLGAVIDGFAAYLAAHPDFRTLAYGAPGQQGRAISPALFEHQAEGGAMADLLRESLSTLYGLEPDEGFPFRLFAHAFAQPDQAARERVLAEAKVILAPYLFPPGG